MLVWLKSLRTREHFAQKAIADLAEISQQQYSCIEQGNRRPSVDTAKKIAAVLNFDWTMFFEDSSQK